MAAPPENTQIKPRCLTCEHFGLCKYCADYLKTITAVQQAIGDPLVSLEVKPEEKVPDFRGVTIVLWRKYFPVKITLADYDEPLAYNLAKFQSLNEVHILYQTPKNFIVLRFLYNKDEETFELDYCRDAFYQRIDYEVSEDDLVTLKEGLLQWRADQIDSKIEPLFPLPPHKDVVNTTHFSAALECDLYQWNHMTFEDAVKYCKTKYPNGIPIDDQYYHIATFHVDNRKIPYSPLYLGVVDKEEKPHPEAQKRRDLT